MSLVTAAYHWWQSPEDDELKITRLDACEAIQFSTTVTVYGALHQLATLRDKLTAHLETVGYKPVWPAPGAPALHPKPPLGPVVPIAEPETAGDQADFARSGVSFARR